VFAAAAAALGAFLLNPGPQFAGEQHEGAPHGQPLTEAE
jgi:hypothetical protein